MLRLTIVIVRPIIFVGAEILLPYRNGLIACDFSALGTAHDCLLMLVLNLISAYRLIQSMVRPVRIRLSRDSESTMVHVRHRYVVSAI